MGSSRPGGLGLHCRMASYHAPAVRQYDNVGEKAVVPDDRTGRAARTTGRQSDVISTAPVSPDVLLAVC